MTHGDGHSEQNGGGGDVGHSGAVEVLSEESDDEFWARLLGDDDPCALGKDWSDRVVFVQEEADHV